MIQGEGIKYNNPLKIGGSRGYYNDTDVSGYPTQHKWTSPQGILWNESVRVGGKADRRVGSVGGDILNIYGPGLITETGTM